MDYEENKKSFLERLQSLDRSAKRTTLISATAVVVIIVIYVWLGYFSGLVSNVSQPVVSENQPSQTPQAASGSSFWQNIKNGMANMIDVLRSPGQYSIKPN
jgi:hypothetical protein